MPTPKAVLLDVGGVLLVPLHDRILGAFARAGFTPATDVLDRAHYAGAALGIDAEDAWYVGDTPAVDVVGARAAGMHVVVMDPYQFHLDATYDRVDSLPDLAGRVTAN